MRHSGTCGIREEQPLACLTRRDEAAQGRQTGIWWVDGLLRTGGMDPERVRREFLLTVLFVRGSNFIDPALTQRENILFGAEFDEERYWDAVQNASLLSDLEMLPDGDLTEVRESHFYYSTCECAEAKPTNFG